MANVAERIRWAYEGERIPYDTFVSGVPFALRSHEDNQVLPFLGTIKAPDGTQAKWIRFSDFLPFKDACHVYWMDKESSKYLLYLYVMPYTPLQDCFYLCQLLDVPRDAGDDSKNQEEGATENKEGYAEAAKEVTPVQDCSCPYEKETPTQNLTSNENQDDHMQQAMEIQEEGAAHIMEGHVEVADGVTISFRVVNSNLLWSKVSLYECLNKISDPLQEHLYQIDAYIAKLTIEQGDNLLLAADEARGRLVLALMEQFTVGMQGSDPHDAILSIYPQMHYQIYTNICPYCDLKQQYTEYLSDSIWNRLQLARTELHERFQVNDRLSICQEEFNLMAAEGALVVHNCLSQTNNLLYRQIRAQVEELRNKTMNDTLAGVLNDYEDGNYSEDDNSHPEEH